MKGEPVQSSSSNSLDPPHNTVAKVSHHLSHDFSRGLPWAGHLLKLCRYFSLTPVRASAVTGVTPRNNGRYQQLLVSHMIISGNLLNVQHETIFDIDRSSHSGKMTGRQMIMALHCPTNLAEKMVLAVDPLTYSGGVGIAVTYAKSHDDAKKDLQFLPALLVRAYGADEVRKVITPAGMKAAEQTRWDDTTGRPISFDEDCKPCDIEGQSFIDTMSIEYNGCPVPIHFSIYMTVSLRVHGYFRRQILPCHHFQAFSSAPFWIYCVHLCLIDKVYTDTNTKPTACKQPRVIAEGATLLCVLLHTIGNRIRYHQVNSKLWFHRSTFPESLLSVVPI